MAKALGMLEYQTISVGIQAADLLVKTSEIEIIEAQTVCPGKYIILFSGELSGIKVAIEVAKQKFGQKLIDSFILGNPNESIFSALYGATKIEEKKALGIVETFSVSSIIVAADEATKTSIVELVDLRIARGMCGKSYMMINGEVSAVESAIEKTKKIMEKSGMLIDYSVIANPDPKIWNTII